jgi:hypothetical protein
MVGAYRVRGNLYGKPIDWLMVGVKPTKVNNLPEYVSQLQVRSIEPNYEPHTTMVSKSSGIRLYGEAGLDGTAAGLAASVKAGVEWQKSKTTTHTCGEFRTVATSNFTSTALRRVDGTTDLEDEKACARWTIISSPEVKSGSKKTTRKYICKEFMVQWDLSKVTKTTVETRKETMVSR